MLRYCYGSATVLVGTWTPPLKTPFLAHLLAWPPPPISISLIINYPPGYESPFTPHSCPLAPSTHLPAPLLDRVPQKGAVCHTAVLGLPQSAAAHLPHARLCQYGGRFAARTAHLRCQYQRRGSPAGHSARFARPGCNTDGNNPSHSLRRTWHLECPYTPDA